MTRSLRFVSSSKKRLTLVGALLVALAAGLVASAYWTSTGTGTGTAGNGTLTSPAAVTATTHAHIAWSAVAPPNGVNAEVTYTVERDGGSGFVVAAGTCAGSLPQATVSCDDDPSLASGSYVYRVTAHWRSWTAAASSGPVAIDLTPPTSAITFPAASGAYNDAGWNSGCSSAICGTAADDIGGSGVTTVEVSILGPGGYWNGFDFTHAGRDEDRRERHDELGARVPGGQLRGAGRR